MPAIYSTLEVVWMVMFSFHPHKDNEHIHAHSVSLTQIHSAGESHNSTHSSLWPICYCLAEMYFCEQKARLPTKRQIKRLGLKGRRLWSAAQAETEDMMSRWEMTTALNSHTNLAGTGERSTPTPGWVFCGQYRSHHCFHTQSSCLPWHRITHTLNFEPLRKYVLSVSAWDFFVNDGQRGSEWHVSRGRLAIGSTGIIPGGLAANLARCPTLIFLLLFIIIII